MWALALLSFCASNQTAQTIYNYARELKNVHTIQQEVSVPINQSQADTVEYCRPIPHSLVDRPEREGWCDH